MGTNEDQGFLLDVLAEVQRARAKFPSSECSVVALMEEVGELAKATLSEDAGCVRDEAIQVAAMALRVAIEGDISLGACRRRAGQSAEWTGA